MSLYLDSRNSPHIRIGVFLPSLMVVDCLIDTGFSGVLVLPDGYLSTFHKKPIVYQEYELADGSLNTCAVYKTNVTFGNVNKEVALMFTKTSEGLVGIEFLTGFTFVLNLKKLSVMLE